MCWATRWSKLAVELIERAEESVAQPHGASDDRVEDRLHVGLGSADDPQDLARGGLLLQRLSDLRVGVGQCAVLLLEFLEEAHVLDRDDGLVGEGAKQCDLRVCEAPILLTKDHDGARRPAVSKHRDAQRRAVPHGSGQSLACRESRVVLHVFHVHNVAIQHRPTGDQVPVQWVREEPGGRFEPVSCLAVLSDEVNHIPLEPAGTSVVSAAQSHRAFGNRVEDWLDVGRRMADHAQDLARRRLLLQRLGDLRMSSGEGSVLFLELREQPDVLNGDDCLIGEGLEQSDLFVRERVHLGAPEHYRAHRRSLPQQWNAQYRSPAMLMSQGLAFGKALHLGLNISHVNSPPLEHRAPRDGPPYDWNEAAHGMGDRTVMGGHPQGFRVKTEHASVVGSAEARGALDHRIQHWLEIRR